MVIVRERFRSRGEPRVSESELSRLLVQLTDSLISVRALSRRWLLDEGCAYFARGCAARVLGDFGLEQHSAGVDAANGLRGGQCT